MRKNLFIKVQFSECSLGDVPVWHGGGRRPRSQGRSAHYGLKGAGRLRLLFSMYSLMFLLSNG